MEKFIGSFMFLMCVCALADQYLPHTESDRFKPAEPSAALKAVGEKYRARQEALKAKGAQ